MAYIENGNEKHSAHEAKQNLLVRAINVSIVYRNRNVHRTRKWMIISYTLEIGMRMW